MLGPYLQVFGLVTSLPLPYNLLEHLPVFSAVRAVGRASVFVGMAISVLLFWVFATQFHRRSSVIVTGVVLALEFLFYPFPTQSTVLSSAYAYVALLPGSTVLEIPAGTNYTAASRSLFASRLHGKDVLGSIALERAQDSSAFSTVKSAPVIRQLLYLRTTDLRQDRPEFFNQNLAETFYDTARFFDLSAVVIHKDSVSLIQNTALSRFLEEDVHLIPQDFGDVVVYPIDLDSLNVFASDGVFLMRDGNWSNVGFDPLRSSVFAEINDTASITVVNTNTESVSTQFSLSIPPESPSGILITDQNDEVIASFAKDTANVSFTLDLDPGSTALFFRKMEGQKTIIQNPSMTTLK